MRAKPEIATSSDEPCARCAANTWVTRRPGLWSGTLTWLRWGGHWRPTTTVCGHCGEATQYTTGWLTSPGPQSRRSLPGRLLKAGWWTVAQRRTAEPHSWLYLASAGVGAVVGGGAAIATRSGRLPLGALTGSGAGLVICWSVFAQTAMRAPGLGSDMWTALLQEAAPERALRRRLDEQARLAQTATFPVYGLAAWTGLRQLAGYGSRGMPGGGPTVTSLTLGHGDPQGDKPWVLVETAMPDMRHRSTDRDSVEHSLARDLWTDEPRPPQDMSQEDAVRWSRTQELARAGRPFTPWTDTVLTVDGYGAPSRWLGDGELWVAHLEVSGVRVVVRAHDVPVEQVDLVRVDVSAYAAAG